jgi:hypothetical protein
MPAVSGAGRVPASGGGVGVDGLLGGQHDPAEEGRWLGVVASPVEAVRLLDGGGQITLLDGPRE